MISTYLADEQATQNLARHLAGHMQPPLVITLRGDLGAGKTCFVRALLQAFGLNNTIKSPTFTLVESYSINDRVIHHFDLYRLEAVDELEDMGFRDYFQPTALCLVEWPEKVPAGYIPADVVVQLEYEGTGRRVQISAMTVAGQNIINHAQGLP